MVTIATLAVGLCAPVAAHDAARFPEDFVGNWAGEMAWHRPSTLKTQAFKMQLRIQPTGEENVYTFVLKYGDQPARNYRLRPVDQTEGRWTIDEGGGVNLDGLWLANRFSCPFGIGANNVMLQMWREGAFVQYEMTSFDLRDPGPGGVSSHFVTNIQRAALQKR